MGGGVFTQIRGAKAILKKLKAQDKSVLAAAIRGLKKAGLRLQRESQKVVPVDTGALKRSAFTNTFGKGKNTDVVVGYAIHYAIYVHENLYARHARGKIAKYLEVPARKFKDILLKIIADEIARAQRKAK